MPILHTQITAQGKAPDGKTVDVPPAIALQMRGPLIQVTVTIEENAGKALLSLGKALPTPKTGWALIDTGASNTCVDEQAAKELGLPVIDVGTMLSATHERVPSNIYPVQVATPIVSLNSPRTMGAALAAQGLLVLIGRDVLQRCNLFYNGPIGQFTLSL
jgi:predicted aspartyl protease